MKLLHREHGSFVLYCKHLERGTFEWPAGRRNLRELSWQELVMMVEGIVLKTVQKRDNRLVKRYSERFRLKVLSELETSK